MKRITTLLLVAMVGIMCACGEPDAPIDNKNIEKDTPAKQDETQTVPQDQVVEGTKIDPANNACGVIYDADGGKGIPDVVISDGYTCTKTDANGVYQFKLDAYARVLSVSIPSEYQIPLDEKTHLPLFYCSLPVKKDQLVRNDFTLTALDKPEKQFTMVMIGDPQVRSAEHVNRYKNETIPDIVKMVGDGQKAGKYHNTYAMTLGDIVFDAPSLWNDIQGTMENIKTDAGWIPFFQCIGNHDHNATRSNDYDAVTDFVNHFGPTDYSFNRGDVHIVTMDNIVGISSSGSTWTYCAGFSDEQLEWLTQDLALVPDKEDKMVFLCCHIPFRKGGQSGKGASVNKDKHHKDFLNLLTQFKEAHIMIGHTHYAQNYIHTDFKCKGGQPIYEHIHQAACGAWWAANSSTSGAPNGYNIYEIDGSSVVNWINKGTGRDESYQLRVYDGNQSFAGTKGYEFQWYTPEAYGGEDGILIMGNTSLEDCFVAEVWDDDDQNVTVEFWQNGRKSGDFTRLENGTCMNIPLCAFWFNEKDKNTTSWASKTASHYWYYKPTGGTPSTITDWEVKVFRTIPSSGKVNTWSRSDLTTDYSEY